jgi:hypothetical protein
VELGKALQLNDAMKITARAAEDVAAACKRHRVQ